MQEPDDIYQLPKGLPVPTDDGACDHLVGMRLPSIPLASTRGEVVNLADRVGRTVVYCYPRTGRPDEDVPPGWNETPGARGCTPQSCAFRDRYEELHALGTEIFGLSSQTTDYQREAAERLRLPFALLSDPYLAFARALGLPTFQIADMVLIKRLTLVLDDGVIEKVFYPVFPPDENAGEVIDWLKRSRRRHN